MTEHEIKTIRYFQGMNGYFWKWAEGGDVLEFANGGTICYREDLVFILDSLEISAEITIGTVLLLLCACKDNSETLFEPGSYLQRLGYRSDYQETEHMVAKQMIRQALELMKLINGLPFECRSGIKRVTLCQAVLENSNKQDGKPLKSILKTFRGGSLDELIFNRSLDFGFTALQTDLMPLAFALEQFKDTATLEMKLRTGITNIPVKAAIPLPAPAPDDLMATLTADLKTAGLARLAHQISAALNIPMHLSGSSDQSIGGVSDISNRGHFDKLLLSELAQDDLLLTARLANNEALFLQREELPDQANQEWHILLDTTLKMWGMPRVFGLAAALAFSEGRKRDPLDAWALGGKVSLPMELHTKEGILTTLEQLDPALNCGAQLKKLVSDTVTAKAKYILITGPHYREDPAFMTAFAQVKEQLDYLVEVNRDGHIALYETRGKRYKLAATALIDLEETLFNRKRPAQRNYNLSGLPAMLSETDFPLLFPSSKIKLKHDNTFKMSTGQTAIITQDRRVLCWTEKDQGARELVDQLDAGDYYWGQVKTYLFILVRNLPGAYLRIYQVDLENPNLMIHELNNIKAEEVKFDNGLFHIARVADVVSVDPLTGQSMPTAMDRKLFKALPSIPHFQVLNQIKKLINNGYSVINSAKNIYVNTSGRLYIDQREIRLDQHGRNISLKDNSLNSLETVKPVKQENIEVAHLPYIKFTKFSWADGSEAVLDSRGFLHLKSSDADIPESSIILVIEKTTACWSADGKITGSSYFTGNRQSNVMLAADFYHTYIEPFIRQLK
ncbi:hypothetical protein BDD43_1985 [Mucilaginibacter gracilis]|uniref:Uncharacterized protein n=1 Tax=Mucilaginibacter gracilis TaxID=423350 RepID=A0A495IYR2_9SPHI|nr:hypothetical protein [Mucilaginibacter gracilis]RKR81827.1 hypothetical protein BDD43_1985 [Mucilaginibacter gracilis]